MLEFLLINILIILFKLLEFKIFSSFVSRSISYTLTWLSRVPRALGRPDGRSPMPSQQPSHLMHGHQRGVESSSSTCPRNICPVAQTRMQHSTSFLDSLILVLDLLQLTSQWPIHIYRHVCGGAAVSSTISMVILSIKSSLGVCLKRWVVRVHETDCREAWLGVSLLLWYKWLL